MKKFFVTADLDYITGHLRYGHLEGIIEAESEEALKEMIKEKGFDQYLEVVADNYEIVSYGDVNEYKYKEVK